MIHTIRNFAACIAFGAATLAQAVPVTIDFEGYGPGTLITNEYAGLGVTFSSASISNYTCCGTPTATLVTATDGGDSGRTGFLDIFFSLAVSGVSLGYDNYGSFAGGSLQAFDSGDNLLETLVHTSAADNALEFMSFSSSNIAKIVVTSPGGTGWLVAIDNLTFDSNSVPEPDSLALLGVALLGLVGSRKRKA